MIKFLKKSDGIVQTTLSAFLWTHILGVPFWGLLNNLLTFILYKDLHISPLQITLIVALKPMSSLLAPYWSQAIHQRPDNISSNLAWANILRYLPFLFVPWVHSSWYIIFAFGVYMLLCRAAIPGWMELFKHNLPEAIRERIVGYKSTIDYCGNAVLTLGLAVLLDNYEHAWRWLFMSMALLGLSSTWLLYRLPSPAVPILEVEKRPFDIREKIVKPWKQAWQLIKERPDFLSFQIGFMLGGGGLMIMQPAFPVFFVDTLKLSYTEMSIALAICKGIGVALASPFWSKLFRKIDIFYFSGLVTLLAALFPLFLIISPINLSLLYLAYILYGFMQAGSELSWHMSGLYFAKEKDSSAYSSMNVLTVGMRGCVIPALGALILTSTNAYSVMVLGGLLCLGATWHLMRYSKLELSLKTPPY